jgi:Protein of unknown function (DUF4242)
MRFMCTHTVPPGAITPDQLKQMAQAGQNDAKIKGVRSFVNLSQGKAICVMDAPDKGALVAWFQKMKMPFETITPVEFEGDHGNVHEMARERVMA